MAIRNLADLLEEITMHEQAVSRCDDAGGYHALRLSALRHEVMEHPAGAAGRDLPSIVVVLGG